MDALLQELERKTATQQNTVENLGTPYYTQEDVEQAQTALLSIESQLDGARTYAQQSDGRPLEGNKIKVLFQKVLRGLIRALFGWYIAPILAKQTIFNQHTVNTLEELTQQVKRQQHIIMYQQKQIYEQSNAQPD